MRFILTFVPEYDIECESSTLLILYLHMKKKYYLQVYLDNCTYKQTNDRLSWQQSFWRLDIINAVLL